MLRGLAAAAVVALGVAAGAADGAREGVSLTGRIVVSATGAPLSGDVTLVRAGGRRVDLSRSPALDLEPVLSPDGRRVAFFSTRGGHGAEYVVAVDGAALRRVTPWLAAPPQVAWAPNARDLAVAVGSGAGAAVYRASARGGGWARLARTPGGVTLAGWSPDGTSVAFVTALDDVDVVKRTGRRLFRVDGAAALWSPAGRLAARRSSDTWDVYDGAGRRLSSLAAYDVAWSPRGRLASVTPHGALEIRNGGVGRPVVTARPAAHAAAPRWAGEGHVLLRSDGGAVLFDVAHRATFIAPAAYRTVPALTPDGTAFGESSEGTLLRSTLAGSTRVVAAAGPCGGKDADPFASLQALPDGSGAVYASSCARPHDLYSLLPDGGALTRLASTPQDELAPAVAPDGSTVAFARVDSAGCVGCTHVLVVADAGLGASHTVPLPSSVGGPILQDDDPSFSPDGTSFVFTRWDSSVSDQAFLYTEPTAGGAPRPLAVAGGNAAWGPGAIAFDGAAGVETVRADGTGAAPVPGTAKLDDGVPAWSGDGRLALLERGATLAILLPATRTRIPLPGLAPPPLARPRLAWSPDGTRLAFTAADLDGAVDVWTIGVDGHGLVRVTHGLDADGGLAWR